MAFKTFAPGVLTSSDVNTFLMRQAVIVCTSSTRPASPNEGMTIYETDTDRHAFYTGTAWRYFGGKILQVVRATDATQRSTTSTSAVDASISVTITPLYSNSNVLLIWDYEALIDVTSADVYLAAQITTSANTLIVGNTFFGRSSGTTLQGRQALIGWASPGSTSAITYKGRFFSLFGATVKLGNTANIPGQLFALEVSA
jgi:hypothetical protein